MDVFDLTARLIFDSSDYEHGLESAGKSASGFAKSASGMFSKAAEAFAGFAKDSIATGMQFDKSISQVAATLGQSTEEVQQLSNFAKQMGATTAFSAQQAAEGLNYMALAGYDAQKSMEMLPKVMDLAAAGCMELGRASDMVTDASSALGLDVSETTTLIDQMAKTASSSNTSVTQLGDAILQIGGTAKDMKGGTLELTTVLGILADNGMKGAEGGTHLRNMMNSLIDPAGEAADVMEQYGLSLFDAQGNMRGLNEVFSDLNGVLDGMSAEDRKKTIATLFNARDMKAAEALLASTAGRYDELSGKIMESEGAAADMAKTQLDNLAGDVTIFKSGLEGLKLAISDVMTPFLRNTVSRATSLIGNAKNLITSLSSAFEINGFDGLTKMIDLKFEDLQLRISEFIDNFLPVVVGRARSILSKLPGLVAQLVSRVANLISSNAGKIASSASELIADFVSSITNPGAITSILKAALSIITSFANAIISPNTLNPLLEKAPEIIRNLVEAIVAAVPLLLDAAKEIVIAIGKYLFDPENIDKIFTAGADILLTLIEGLGSVLKSLYDWIMDTAEEIADYFGFGDYWRAGKDVIDEFMGGVKEEWDKWSDFWEGFGEYIYDALHNEDNEVDWENYIDNALNNTGDTEHVGKKDRTYDLRATRDYSAAKEAQRIADFVAENQIQGVPVFGNGGIVTKPTLAMIGDDGAEAVVPLEKDSETGRMFGGISISFGNIYVHGGQNAGQEVVRQIDEALRIWQIQQKRGIGGTAWQT